MRKFLMFFAFIFYHGLAAQEQNQTLGISAELVWVQSAADDHRIMFSRLSSGEWSYPLTLYGSENFISTPTISSDLEQNKLIVWSEQKDGSSVLMSAQRAPSDTSWQQAEKINDFKAENLSPSIVVDSRNRQWLFWSSNYEGLDDIYYSRKEGPIWSNPRRVHVNNQVPDIQPVARLNQDLSVVVAWDTYDLRSGLYLTVQQVFTIDKLSEKRYNSGLSNSEENSISDITLPDFLPRDSAIGLHFPNNRIEQSIRLDLNR
jgi:hypothetical protein